jgi:secernin
MCDTLVVAPELTKNGATLLAKNSDREMNEPQVAQYFEGANYSAGAKVACTYMEVPQIGQTAAIYLSRPTWMFGGEMGVNEHGVAIGNEAVFARMPVPKTGLLGMDLLRLALERATTAEQALEVIVGLLADHGQGGAAGFTDKKMRYHNSFLIADPGQAWVLETVGKLWIAEKVTGVRTISNCLSIGEQYDRVHPELIETASRKGFLKKGEDLDFAACFSDRFYTYFAQGKKRSTRGRELLEQKGAGIELKDMIDVLTDHGAQANDEGGELLFGGLGQICMHAVDPLISSSQTTASLAVELSPGRPRAFFTGTSAPCTSVFRPVAFDVEAHQNPPEPGLVFAKGSLWWEHELLHRELLRGFYRLAQYRKQADEYQAKLLSQTQSQSGPNPESYAGVAAAAWEQAIDQTRQWHSAVVDLPRRDNRSLRTKWLHRKLDKAANLRLAVEK